MWECIHYQLCLASKTLQCQTLNIICGFKNLVFLSLFCICEQEEYEYSSWLICMRIIWVWIILRLEFLLLLEFLRHIRPRPRLQSRININLYIVGFIRIYYILHPTLPRCLQFLQLPIHQILKLCKNYNCFSFLFSFWINCCTSIVSRT